MTRKRSAIFWCPEERGGIAEYFRLLSPAVMTLLRTRGISCSEWRGPMSEGRLKILSEEKPDCFWMQHEFGFFGSKVPVLNTWPKIIESIRRAAPNMKTFMTAHSVLPPDFRYPVRGSILQKLLRSFANTFLIKSLRTGWMWSTFKDLDVVFVHSQHQAKWIEEAGVPTCARTIPLFVPEALKNGDRLNELDDRSKQRITVFGYQSNEKGQDIAIAALEQLRIEYKIDAELVIAGGARREEDQPYADLLKRMVNQRELESFVRILGFIPESKLAHVYQASDVILAPFRDTTGSASLVRAFAQGAPVVTSNLLLNLEIEERSPGTLRFFESENATDCARVLAEVLQSAELRRTMSESSMAYAKEHSLAVCAQKIADEIIAEIE
jgi:glycosyltransferase involved in cell wall biosynthesis